MNRIIKHQVVELIVDGYSIDAICYLMANKPSSVKITPEEVVSIAEEKQLYLGAREYEEDEVKNQEVYAKMVIIDNIGIGLKYGLICVICLWSIAIAALILFGKEVFLIVLGCELIVTAIACLYIIFKLKKVSEIFLNAENKKFNA